jgi:hypothetical protein
MKIDKVRAHREELKRLLFSLPTKGRKVVKTITVNYNNNPWWEGYGDIKILSDGPDGYCSFSTHEENPFLYLSECKEFNSGEYELIVK